MVSGALFLMRSQFIFERSEQLLSARQVRRLRESSDFFICEFSFYCFACDGIVECAFWFCHGYAFRYPYTVIVPPVIVELTGLMVNPVYEVADLTIPPANPPPWFRVNLLVYVVSTVLNGL